MDHSFESVCREYEVALRELLEAMTAPFPSEDKGQAAQTAWGDRQTNAVNRAKEVLAAQQSAPILDGDRTDQIAAFTHGIAPQAEAHEPECPIVEGWQISVADGHSGYGVYAHMSEYPEEGAVFLLSIPTGAQVEEPAAGRRNGE